MDKFISGLLDQEQLKAELSRHLQHEQPFILETSTLPHTKKQPSSLPPDLVAASQADLHRLHELRRLVQDECDQLLVKKEYLQQDLVLGQQGLWLLPSSSSSKDGSLSLDSSLRLTAKQQQQPQLTEAKRAKAAAAGNTGSGSGSSNMATHALSSLAKAYKVSCPRF